MAARPGPVANRSSLSYSGRATARQSAGQCRSPCRPTIQTAARRLRRSCSCTGGHGLAPAHRDGTPRHQERVEVETDGEGALPVHRGADRLPGPRTGPATRAAHTAPTNVIPAR